MRAAPGSTVDGVENLGGNMNVLHVNLSQLLYQLMHIYKIYTLKH